MGAEDAACMVKPALLEIGKLLPLVYRPAIVIGIVNRLKTQLLDCLKGVILPGAGNY